MIDQDVINKRPPAFEGMPFYAARWRKIGPNTARRVNEGGWVQFESDVLLPGEPGCPLLPEAMRAAEGDTVIWYSNGAHRWQLATCVSGAPAKGCVPIGTHAWAKAIKVPEGYELVVSKEEDDVICPCGATLEPVPDEASVYRCLSCETEYYKEEVEALRDPGDGYRLLKHGEIIKDGDQRYAERLDGWRWVWAEHSVGHKYDTDSVYRRKVSRGYSTAQGIEDADAQYRSLERHEKRQDEDEARAVGSNGNWAVVGVGTGNQLQGYLYRRKIRLQDDEHRFIDPGEVLQEGDEFQTSIEWRPICDASYGMPLNPNSVTSYRRRITTTNYDSTPKSSSTPSVFEVQHGRWCPHCNRLLSQVSDGMRCTECGWPKMVVAQREEPKEDKLKLSIEQVMAKRFAAEMRTLLSDMRVFARRRDSIAADPIIKEKWEQADKLLNEIADRLLERAEIPREDQ